MEYTMMRYIWLCPLVAVVVLYIYRAGYIHSDRRANLPLSKGDKSATYKSLPQASKWPLGLDFLLATLKASDEHRLMEFFLDNFRNFGNTFQQVIGSTTAIFTIEPENVKSVLQSNVKDWGLGLRRTILFPFLGEGISLQEGHAWKQSRDILRPHFYHRLYDDLAIFKPHVESLLDAISSDATANAVARVVNLGPLFSRLTLDVTTEFFFDESVHCQRPTSSLTNHDFEEAFDAALNISARRLRYQKLYWLVGEKKLRKACATIHQFADGIIDKTLSSGADDATTGDKPPFHSAVAQHYPDRNRLRGQVINVLIAGRDSAGTFLSWTFFHLVRHPAVMAKLRSEISQVDETTAPLTRSNLIRMTYLQNVLKEILRLHPPVPLISRTALRDTTLPTGGGPDGSSPVFVPKGTSVLYSAYCIHRRQDLFGKDAEVFRPDRWDEELLQSRDAAHRSWTFLAFGGGPRVCLGMDFSLTETAYTVVRILQRFPSIGLPVDEPVEVPGKEKQTVTFSLNPADGCRVVLDKV